MLLTGADTLHRYPSSTLPFEVVNNYGPTETTVVATSGLVPRASGPGPLPSIGRPIDNTRAYVLDANLQAVPTGTIGELYVGGRGVARGYLTAPSLRRSASSQIPSPAFRARGCTGRATWYGPAPMGI